MKKAFTLAEVLITLTIIGVVAAVTIPSVVSNSKQHEYKTGLKKSITVLNEAIKTNIALHGETPYNNTNLFGYFARHMSVVKSTTNLNTYNDGWITKMGLENAALYTADGMRFEFRAGTSELGRTADVLGDTTGTKKGKFKLYESNEYACARQQMGGAYLFRETNAAGTKFSSGRCGGCGSYGLAQNPNNTRRTPCVILVDVNGDNKPSPSNKACHDSSCRKTNKYITSDPNTGYLGDVFSLLITESQVIPYGYAAQKAIYSVK